MKRLARNAAFLLIGDGVSRLIGFLSTVYLARVLGVADFGVVAIGLSALAYAMWASDVGLGMIGAREFAKSPADRITTMASLVWLRVILSLVTITVGTSLVYFLYGPSTSGLVVCVFLFSAFSTALALDWYYQGLQQTAPIALARIIFSVTYLAGLYVYVPDDTQVLMVPWCYFAATTLSSLSMIFWIEDADWKWNRPELVTWRRLIRSSLTVGTGSLMAQMVITIPPIAIGFFWGESEAGRFGAASKLTFLALAADRILGALFVPAVSRMYSNRDPRINERLRITVKYVVAGGVCVSGIGGLYAPQLFDLLFGDEFSLAAPIFVILIWFVPAALLNTTYGFGLIAMDREKDFQKAMIGGGLSSLFLIAGLTAIWGTTGAAIGVVMGELTTVALTYVRFRRVVVVNPFVGWIRPLLIVLVITGLMSMLQPPLWSIPAAVMSFVFLFAATGGWSLTEWRMLTGKTV